MIWPRVLFWAALASLIYGVAERDVVWLLTAIYLLLAAQFTGGTP